jgi:prolyl-tRNA synthetase
VKGEAERLRELPLEEVATPGKETIEEVAQYLGVTPRQTLKAVFYIAGREFIFVVIRGDLEVNEVKLKKTLKATDLRLASSDEVKEAGIKAGSASPVGLVGVRIIADDSLESGTNFVAGANKAGCHFRNVNYGRDFKADVKADIAKASSGHICSNCGGSLAVQRGMEVGHVFKLGTAISRAIGAIFVDQQGQSQPVIMGSYGIGVGRLMAAVIELNHDDKGIMWPAAVAPYQVYLCSLYTDNPEVVRRADKVYEELVEKGVEVLYDDRPESPGVKFNDADLLGIPVRVTISPRSLEKGSAEIKKRAEKKGELVALEEAAAFISRLE